MSRKVFRLPTCNFKPWNVLSAEGESTMLCPPSRYSPYQHNSSSHQKPQQQHQPQGKQRQRPKPLPLVLTTLLLLLRSPNSVLARSSQPNLFRDFGFSDCMEYNSRFYRYLRRFHSPWTGTGGKENAICLETTLGIRTVRNLRNCETNVILRQLLPPLSSSLHSLSSNLLSSRAHRVPATWQHRLSSTYDVPHQRLCKLASSLSPGGPVSNAFPKRHFHSFWSSFFLLRGGATTDRGQSHHDENQDPNPVDNGGSSSNNPNGTRKPINKRKKKNQSTIPFSLDDRDDAANPSHASSDEERNSESDDSDSAYYDEYGDNDLMEDDDDFPEPIVYNVAAHRPIPESTVVPVSVHSIQGQRRYMEDDFVVSNDLFAVFDGHGGAKVAQYLRRNLVAEFQAARTEQQQQQQQQRTSTTSSGYNTLSSSSIITGRTGDSKNVPTDQDQQAPPQHIPQNYAHYPLERALQSIDEKVQAIRHWSFQGSTCVACWIMPHSQQLLTANIGDSRAIVCRRDGTILALTRDHKPDDPDERERIYALGGTVTFHGYVDALGKEWGCHRVNGVLAMSRAIGDRSERPAVTAEPEITALPLSALDEFCVVATDGLWDVMSNEEVATWILEQQVQQQGHEQYSQNYSSSSDPALVAERGNEIAEKLVREALRRGVMTISPS